MIVAAHPEYGLSRKIPPPPCLRQWRAAGPATRTSVDWRVLLGALRKTGYGGAVTVGSMALRPAPSPAKYRIWRAMMPDGPPEALLRCTSTGVPSLREAMRG